MKFENYKYGKLGSSKPTSVLHNEEKYLVLKF